MPISVLDAKPALVVIDLQKGIVGMPTAHPMADVIDNSIALVDAFRRHRLPVILVNVDGVPPGRAERSFSTNQMPAGWTELIGELNRQPSDHLVTKKTRGAFTSTGLEQHFRRLGVTQVVVVGVATSSGVESTARQAHELGFHVVLVTDAMTDTDAEAHHNSVVRILPKMSETATTRQLLDLLDPTHVKRSTEHGLVT
jgi:nicotinamidase-related amidase